MGNIYSDDEESLFGSSSNSSKKKYERLPVLNSFGTNLTDLALEDKLDPVIGRDEEIKRTIQILGRRKKNNPVLVGFVFLDLLSTAWAKFPRCFFLSSSTRSTITSYFLRL